MAPLLQGSGLQRSLTVAGQVFTDLDNLIVLKGGITSTNKRSTPRRGFSTSGYQVPVGKTLRVLALELVVTVVGSGEYLQIGYCDNDLGLAGTTAATNQKTLGTGAAVAGGKGDGILQCTTLGLFSANVLMDVPTGKYLFLENYQTGSYTAHVTLYGYLV